MKLILTIFITLSLCTTYGQENFGMKEKVNGFVEKKITNIFNKEVLKRLENYNNLRENPRKYFSSIGISSVEMDALIKIFPELKTRSLPRMIMRDSGIFTVRDRGSVVKFSFKSLAKSEVYINGVKVILPDMKSSSFGEYVKSFNSNMYKAFNKKTSFLYFLNSFKLISSVNAQEIDYLDIKDGDDVPHYHKMGHDPSAKIIKNLYDDSEFAHNVNQTKQVLLAAIMAISNDIKLFSDANWENKKFNLPNNLKILYGKIDKMANLCEKESINTNKKFNNPGPATEMLTALDLVNEKINRLDTMGKDWKSEVDDLVWRRTSFHVDFNAKSFNICNDERIKKIHYDPNLCSNLDKITQCLIDFRSSGRVSEKRLDDSLMDKLLENPTGKDYGQDDIIDWVKEQ